MGLAPALVPTNLEALEPVPEQFPAAGSDAAQPNEVLNVGDVLRIDLPGEETLDTTFQVDRRGRVRLPEVGYLKVQGYSLEEAERRIRLALSQVFRDLSRLAVSLDEPKVLVKVLGYVNQPGMVSLDEDAGVQAALEAAGGLRAGAQLDRMQLRRDGEMTRFDFKAYLDSGDSGLLPGLRSLDEIFVPASPFVGNVEVDFSDSKLAETGDAAEEATAIKVFGEVRAPGMFAYKESATIVDVLMRAQGVTQYAAVDQIRLITEGEPRKFNLTDYLDRGDRSLLPKLQPGATIFVPRAQEEIKAGRNVVYVMGEVFRPGAFENTDGAGFMDILANAGGPTRYAETRNISILRSDGSVAPFDLHAYTEGLSAIGPPEVNPGDAILVPEKTDINEKSWIKVAPDRAVRIIGEVLRPGRYEWSDEMNLLDLISHVGGPTLKGDTRHIRVIHTDAAGRSTVTPFNLEEYMLRGGTLAEVPRVVAGTTVVVPALPDDPSDAKSQWVRLAPEESIYVMGQVNAPGRYAFNENMSFLDILAAADGPAASADLRNIKVNHRHGDRVRVSTVDLARYFDTGDDTLLPKVKTGDTIYVPDRTGDWRDETPAETVRVLGAVGKPGRYSFDDTQTLLDLLAEAGGPTTNAWTDRITVVNLSCCKDQARVFDMDDFMRRPDFAKIPVVRAGDTVFVPDKTLRPIVQVREGLTDIVRIISLYALIDGLSSDGGSN